MEQGNYADAIDWLERRTLQIGLESADDAPPASLDPNQNPVAEKPSLDLFSGFLGQDSTPEVNRLEKSIYDTSARYNLARCYLALGDYQRAKELLEDDAFNAAQKRGNAKLLQVLK